MIGGKIHAIAPRAKWVQDDDGSIDGQERKEDIKLN